MASNGPSSGGEPPGTVADAVLGTCIGQVRTREAARSRCVWAGKER